MEMRTLGSTGAKVSIIGLGTWQLGTDWGDVSTHDATALLDTALGSGVNFFDTADVYGDGRSEGIIGTWLSTRTKGRPFIATKMGRRAVQVASNYTPDAFEAWNTRSRQLLGVDTIDLIQLHCPPTEVLTDTRTWDALKRMVEAEKIHAYGASVETCEQALIAMEQGASTIQIIVNVFRRKPLEEVLPVAAQKGVGIIARVPLASGLLSGKYTAHTVFPASDHRTYNRDGSAFDIGETFSGIPFDVGVTAAARFTQLCAQYGPQGATPTQVALAWITQTPGITTVIPGARNAAQVQANAAAAALPALDAELLDALEELYNEAIRPHVHHRW